MHRKNPNRKFSLRFGKEETSTEEKRRRLRRLVPLWSFLTRLRRPYLFPCAGKDRGEKGAGMRLVLPASELRQLPMLQASFHTIVTLRIFWYAPPDTGVSNLQLVALEQLPSIEGATEILMRVTFSRGTCRGGALLRPLVPISLEERAEQSPAPTKCTPKASPMKGSCQPSG